eukprot:6484227-Amphidinium_carterae.1
MQVVRTLSMHISATDVLDLCQVSEWPHGAPGMTTLLLACAWKALAWSERLVLNIKHISVWQPTVASTLTIATQHRVCADVQGLEEWFQRATFNLSTMVAEPKQWLQADGP